MKIKFGVKGVTEAGERVFVQGQLETILPEIRSIFLEFISDSERMGSSECFLQDPDFGVGIMNPEKVGIVINLSQAFKKEGRDWNGFAVAMFNLVKTLIEERFICRYGEVHLFFEGCVTDPSGITSFVEVGPEIIKEENGQ